MESTFLLPLQTSNWDLNLGRIFSSSFFSFLLIFPFYYLFYNCKKKYYSAAAVTPAASQMCNHYFFLCVYMSLSQHPHHLKLHQCLHSCGRPGWSGYFVVHKNVCVCVCVHACMIAGLYKQKIYEIPEFLSKQTIYYCCLTQGFQKNADNVRLFKNFW